MLLFLNIDCVLDVPSDAAGPSGDGASGIRRLETVLDVWPRCRIVITSERRYRMTLEHFRGFFSPRLRSRLVGTTRLYDRRRPSERRMREEEVAEFLAHPSRAGAGWIALDSRASEYPRTGHRLVCCETFTANAAAQLHLALTHVARAGEDVLCAA